jgi:proteasome lid subunit RPN8/RPN11
MEAAVPLDPKLLIAAPLWNTLLSELHRRTEGRHESGAFLLGTKADDHREVQQVVYYDQLDPCAYSSGVVILHAASFGPLWDICRARNLSVVADIHLHPRQAWQSEADRTNPMIARAGHLALIAPWFARPPVSLPSLGFFEYRGDHQWRDLSGPEIRRYLIIKK